MFVRCISWLAGVRTSGPHLPTSRISLEYRLMEPSDGIKDVSLLIDLRENPTDISGLRLDVAGILEEVTEREEQLRLHAPDNIRELFVRGAARPKLPQCETDPRIGLIRVCLGAVDRGIDPA